MRPLTDPADRHTPAQVEAQLRSPSAAVGVRWELLDRDLNSIGDITSAVAGTGSVESNTGQAIIGALDFTLEPVEELRGMAFRAHVKPWWQLRMPDGGLVEWPMGVYVWNTPARTVTPSEVWTVTLGDRTHLLDVAGPGPKGFTAFEGDRVTDLIRTILGRAGLSAAGVVDSDEELAEGKSWQFVTKRTAARRRREYIEKLWEQAEGARKRQLARQLAEARRRAPDVEGAATSWLTILTELHDAVGYSAPWFDADGVYQARPARDLADEEPDLVLATDPDGLLVSVETQVDLTAIANRVHLRAENARGSQIGAAVDANDVVPGHPLSEAVIGFYIDHADDDPVAGSREALARRARRTLLEKLSGYETASTPSIAWPVHEPGDLIGLRVDDDPDLADETVWQQTRFTFDLTTGDMTRELRRAWRPS